MDGSLFIDLGFAQCRKWGEDICGDSFQFRKGESGRVIAALSDGLGSGVKANVLASMTAAMALKFAREHTDEIRHAAEIMMSALPVCSVRKISYATFTILNASPDGATRVIEMGNPSFLLFRDGVWTKIPGELIESPMHDDRTMQVSAFQARLGDRIVFFSDGISQAAMGSPEYPLGWEESGIAAFLSDLIRERPELGAHEIAEYLIREALAKEPDRRNKDDMTCAVLYFRHPRSMLLFTGPPYDPAHDRECAELLRSFPGDTAICGGTSAEIVARELGRKLTTDLDSMPSDMPPESHMEGIGLVTEGIYTLTKTASYLEARDGIHHDDPAGRLQEMMLKNDVIRFIVGTRINEAHQDPNLPEDLELRRNIVKRIARILETGYLKKTEVKYV